MDRNYIILSMNPGFDRWLFVESPSPFERVIRADSALKIVSGKGINVARVFNTLGFGRYICANISGGRIGKLIEEDLSTEGLRVESFPVREDSRINFGLMRTYDRSMQVFNEPGPKIDAAEVRGYISFVQSLILRFPSPTFVISGSAPVGFSAEDLLSLIAWASSHGIDVCADIGGAWLKRAVENPLHTLKINREEFEHGFGIDGGDREAALRFKKRFNLRNLIITDGSRGCLAWDETDSGYEARIRETSGSTGFTVGCGDSFFAGYLAGIAKGKSFPDCLVLANACGIANTLHYGPAVFEPADVERSISLIDILSDRDKS